MTIETDLTDKAGLDQLEIISTKFSKWRSSKSSPSERVPVDLLREAQKLTEHVKSSEVRRRLGLTKRQLDKLEELDQKRSGHPAKNTGDKPAFAGQTSTPPNFMAFVPLAEQDERAPLTIDIGTPQGLNIRLSGFAAQDPLPVIAKLIGA